MVTNIYLLRHGEVHNPKKIVYARLPGFILSKKGIAEIEKSAEYLSDKNINHIYSSPLLRARQTAEIIRKKLNLPKVFYTKNLLEVKTSAQGQLGTKMDLIHHNYYSPPVWQKHDDTMQGIAHRMSKILRKLSKKHKGKSVAAVSHGDSILILKALINNLPMELSSIRHERYDINHGEILKIEIVDGKPPKIESVFIPKV